MYPPPFRNVVASDAARRINRAVHSNMRASANATPWSSRRSAAAPNAAAFASERTASFPARDSTHVSSAATSPSTASSPSTRSSSSTLHDAGGPRETARAAALAAVFEVVVEVIEVRARFANRRRPSRCGFAENIRARRFASAARPLAPLFAVFRRRRLTRRYLSKIVALIVVVREDAVARPPRWPRARPGRFASTSTGNRRRRPDPRRRVPGRRVPGSRSLLDRSESSSARETSSAISPARETSSAISPARPNLPSSAPPRGACQDVARTPTPPIPIPDRDPAPQNPALRTRRLEPGTSEPGASNPAPRIRPSSDPAAAIADVSRTRESRAPGRMIPRREKVRPAFRTSRFPTRTMSSARTSSGNSAHVASSTRTPADAAAPPPPRTTIDDRVRTRRRRRPAIIRPRPPSRVPSSARAAIRHPRRPPTKPRVCVSPTIRTRRATSCAISRRI